MSKLIDRMKYGFARLFTGKSIPQVAVLRLEGVIGTGRPGGRTLNLAGLAEQIDKAFELPGVKAIALQIASPGGSPVQSAMIAHRIRSLADEKKLPVFAFTEDIAASGGYMLALAGDKIYAHEASVIGSIGVITAGFGFPDLIEKYGIERRLHATGDRKGMLDPFSPEKKSDVKRLKEIQASIFEFFKQEVERQRGKRLHEDRDRLFSGDIFTGQEAVDLGLADEIGDLRDVMRERFGETVRLRLITEPKPKIAQLLNLQSKAQGGLADEALSALEERLHWMQYGL